MLLLILAGCGYLPAHIKERQGLLSRFFPSHLASVVSTFLQFALPQVLTRHSVLSQEGSLPSLIMPLLPHQKLRARASSALARRFLLSNNGLTRSSTFAAVPPPCHHQDAHLPPMSKIEPVEVESETMKPVYHVSLRTEGSKDKEMEEDLKPAMLLDYEMGECHLTFPACFFCLGSDD